MYLIDLSVCLEMTQEHGAAQGATECVQLHGQLRPGQPDGEGWYPPPAAAVRTVLLKGFGLIPARWLAGVRRINTAWK